MIVSRFEAQTAKAVYIYLLRGTKRTLLIDSGLSDTPEDVLLPGLAAEHLEPQQLTDCVITHADCDHCGGDAALRLTCPHLHLHAPTGDRAMIEQPERLMHQRYEAYEARHGVGYDPETKTWIAQTAGRATPVDSVLNPGDTIDLGGGTLEVMALPGHTAGHLGLHHVEESTLYVGDALLGHGEYALDGTLHAPPSYVTVSGYLDTIERVRALRPERLMFAHREVVEGSGIAPFLDECTRWVHEVDAAVQRGVQRPGGATLRELMEEHATSFGTFNAPVDLMYALSAHLDALVEKGLAHKSLATQTSGTPERFQWVR
ncbi:MBL fold metallo-hydrolase [Deinococcus marmoris]|nr:MBL fold metallo-hydrolase [Deinococcus marmoris]